MKHLTQVTQSPVAEAAKWEDMICVFSQTLSAILEFFGGASPLIDYIASKCEIPTPNDPGE
jgi:hypothetical protein